MPRWANLAGPGSLGSCFGATRTTARPCVTKEWDRWAAIGMCCCCRRPTRHSLRAGAFTFAEEPDRSARDARLVWSHTFDPGVLRAAASPDRSVQRERGFDLSRFAEPVLAVQSRDCEHVSIGRGARILRLDIATGTVLSGPSRLQLQIELGRRLKRQAAAIGPVLALHCARSLAAWRMAKDPRLARLILALRALDALHAGASLRQMAELFPASAGGGWPGRGESAKSRVRRIVGIARKLERGGPAAILSFSF